MTKRYFTFSASKDGDTTTRRFELPEDAPWTAVSCYYFEFLRGMGFSLDPEAVGASYPALTATLEEMEEEDGGLW